MTCAADPAQMTTLLNGKCYGSAATSCRYTEPVFVNGRAAADDDEVWCGKLDVESLLEDAPVDSIHQRTHVEREESMTDGSLSDASESANDDDDVSEKVNLDFIDGQVHTHTHTHTHTYAISCCFSLCE